MTEQRKGAKARYGIRHNDTPPRNGSFPYFASREAAEKVAQAFRSDWPRHTYKVVRIRFDAIAEA